MENLIELYAHNAKMFTNQFDFSKREIKGEERFDLIINNQYADEWDYISEESDSVASLNSAEFVQRMFKNVFHYYL